MALTEGHEKKAAWTKIWELTHTDEHGDFMYYTGLQSGERGDLIRQFSDFLDYGRGIEIGERLGLKDETVSDRDEDIPNSSPTYSEKLHIHNPEHYSFGENRKWIPWAADATSGPKRGQYRDGYPRGLVLHWTAGHRNGLQRGNELMRNTGMLYLIGDKDGNLAQSDSLKWHGYHAGKSSHEFANGYVSDEFVGLELQAAGSLNKRGSDFYSWWGQQIPRNEVAYAESRDNIRAGFYHLYTREQMLLTRKLCCWLHLNNPEIFSIDRVVGHDEVSPGRKVDPGGSCNWDGQTEMSMPELRKVLWEDVAKIKSSTSD